MEVYGKWQLWWAGHAGEDLDADGHDCVRFFFSSRSRHTRLQGDWSSDVCSSDLDERQDFALEPLGREHRLGEHAGAARALDETRVRGLLVAARAGERNVERRDAELAALDRKSVV